MKCKNIYVSQASIYVYIRAQMLKIVSQYVGKIRELVIYNISITLFNEK